MVKPPAVDEIDALTPSVQPGTFSPARRRYGLGDSLIWISGVYVGVARLTNHSADGRERCLHRALPFAKDSEGTRLPVRVIDARSGTWLACSYVPLYSG